MNVLEASTEPTLGPNDKLAEPVKGEVPRQKPWKKCRVAAFILLGGVVVAIHHSFVQAEVADPRLASPLVMVSVVQPEEGGVRSFTGIVAARVESDLGFRVGGKIAERLVDMGQTVRLRWRAGDGSWRCYERRLERVAPREIVGRRGKDDFKSFTSRAHLDEN